MDLSIHCECGKQLPVSPTSAGSEMVCNCGRRLAVPQLSELRRNAGLHPIPLNTVEKIRKLILSGELPSEKSCPLSGRIVDAVVLFRIDCESKWIRGRDPMSAQWVAVYVLLLGWIGALIALWRNDSPTEELGRDVYVEVPLGVSSDCLERVLKLKGQRKLKKLLKQNTTYAKLLEEYPSAIVSVVGKA